MPHFETQLSLACSIEAVFEFLIRPANAAALSPAEMNFTLLEAPLVVEEGSRIRFQVEAMGFKQQIIHEIANFRRPGGFTIKEIEGVLKKFEHQHQLEAQGAAETLLIERVEFEPPGGMVGFLLTESRLIEGLQKSFAHRHRELKQQLERT